jgi:hypothetical protein
MSPGSNVRYLPDEAIEAEASALLAGYARKSGVTVATPALLLDELLQHLGLRFESYDLRAAFGAPDVMGAIYLEERLIRIDEALDPDERPAMRGRFHFSLAHEIGHWCLHRGEVELRRSTEDLFGRPAAPSILCRTGQPKARIEIQADKFASCLLLPHAPLVRAWRRRIGPERLELGGSRLRWTQLSAAGLKRGRIRGDPCERRNEAIEFLIRPLAEEFQVSPPAMRIRLEGLGLIERDVETTAPLFEAG